MVRRIGAQNLKSQEHPATCPSTFPAAPLACGRTLLDLLAFLSAVLRPIFAASQNPPHPHRGRKCAVFVFTALLILTGGNARAQGTVATDRAALAALYNATGGANWTDNTNWLSSEALSEWHGVTTDANGRVTRLNLSSNELSGEIPAELGNLANLSYLNLDVNELSGEIPASLGNLTNLQELSLLGNGLSGAIPAELGDLTNLQLLYLSANELSGEIPAELGNLANLWQLYLWGNELSGAIPAELGDLTNLAVLSLYENELSGEIPAALGDLTNLRVLYLSANELSGEIPAELGDLANLWVLSLYENELSGEIPAELGDLTDLQTLSLSANELSGEIPAALGDLTDLQKLYLYENELSGEIPAKLGDLANLQVLNLYENELSGEIPAKLGDLANLQVLNLYENELSGEIPAALGDLTDLQYLDLYENELSLTNLQKLDLSENELSGEIPAALGELTNLQELILFDNTLSGPLPLTLSALSQLSVLDIRLTTLCAPMDAVFQAWLATINFHGAVCATRPPRGGAPPGGGGPPGGDGPRTSAPGAPRNLTVVGGNGEVVLSWDAPASDGGAAITDYEYRINRSGPWIPIGSTDTTYTVTGLDNGTEYTFQVRAVNAAGRSASTNRAEATPELFTLDFAHFANGDGITSDLVFVNVGTHPIRPVISFYDQEGQPIAAESVVDITGDLEIQEDGSLSIQTDMEPLGELAISTHGRGDLVSGSVKVLSYGPIGGLLRFDLPGIGETVVGASPPVSDTIFPVRRREGGITTGVALHNLGEEAIGVSCRLMSGGVLLEEVEIPLEANGQTSWLIDQAFPAADTSDFAGSVQCDAAGEGLFSALALEMDPGTRVFLTLPLFPVNRRAGGRAASLDFAHFANGDGTTSDLVFVNVSTQRSRPAPTPFHTDILPIRPAIYFYDTEGALVSAESVVDITGDLAVTEDGALTVLTEMGPLGVLTISTHGRGALVSGSVKVLSDGPIGGLLRYNLPHIGEAVVEASPPLGDAIFPVRRREEGGTTGVALHNLESSPGLVRCDLLREGVLRDAASFPLEANGQTSWLIDQAFPGTDTSDFAGSVRCDAVGEGLFSAVALEMDPGTRVFLTLPVFPIPEMPPHE